ncbi:hypothetical protein I3760_06G048900 [Carya illinoinensis]|nr:hypothetical protein I3760_06G048900 [Carya illinoinensis]
MLSTSTSTIRTFHPLYHSLSLTKGPCFNPLILAAPHFVPHYPYSPYCPSPLYLLPQPTIDLKQQACGIHDKVKGQAILRVQWMPQERAIATGILMALIS